MKTSFGLDKIHVEYKSLGPSKPFVCDLPFPISVNAMFGQAPGKKRFPTKEYAAWQEHAAIRLMAQRPPKFPGQVWIRITLEDAGQGDCDNFIKGIPDLLKKHGVIVNDNRRYMREVTSRWGSVSGARVEVCPFPFDQEKAAA